MIAIFVPRRGVGKALTQRAQRFAKERDGICVWANACSKHCSRCVSSRTVAFVASRLLLFRWSLAIGWCHAFYRFQEGVKAFVEPVFGFEIRHMADVLKHLQTAVGHGSL